ncbi:tautomerase family protein [Terriglobus roseus]|jgi:4-oxalocrotonate tautomerase|uniref:Tautomerase n=1 Tax=Terriglobus roseus TaxID=392734 RepID=A0A1H4MR57_9BACT|nr:4-oxalocrotonate tautomerase family protein [Terriglobus roseus]SEB85148.1 4-oxalocrotonate tautomerase [Terriglobus roseus]
MPVIHVQMLGSATREQKAQIVQEFTDTMVRVLGKNPQMTHVILDEKDPENWGHAGELIADRRAKQQA